MLRPVRICAVVVSNADVPGRPVVSLAGNVSFTNCQMSLETPPSETELPALAWPGSPGRSTKATLTLSK